jgi:RNA polymerase sigma-70 factor (ECF subfamily)
VEFAAFDSMQSMNQDIPDNEETRLKAFFEQMVNDHSQLLYAHIRTIVLHYDDTNDVLQNTLINAWKGLRFFKGEAEISTWLYRIATNESLQYLRRKKMRNLIYFKFRTPEISTTIDFASDKAHEKLTEALMLLTIKQRTVFGLRYFNELPYSEIAKVLQVAEGTVKAVYHQSVKKIEKYLIENAE